MSEPHITIDKPNFKPSGFYVYVHRRKTDGKIFYVGKGSGRRAWCKKRHRDWNASASVHGAYCEIVKDGLSETCSFTLEKILYRIFIDRGEPLVNKTHGGEGGKGLMHSEETRRVMSILKAGENHHNYGKTLPDSTRRLMSSLASGEGNPFYGKVHSDETKRKISAAHTGSKNANYRDTVYTFIHDVHGIESCTQNELRHKYGLSHSCLSNVCSGYKGRISHRGWRLHK